MQNSKEITAKFKNEIIQRVVRKEITVEYKIREWKKKQKAVLEKRMKKNST